MTLSEQTPHRSGFVALVGRPNAGKTMLTNALVGEKVGIVSNRPQTTRHAIRGVVHRPAVQIVLVDTPGLHKPKSLLGQRLNDVVRTTWAEVDVIGFCLPANEKIGPGDRFIAKELADIRRTPKIAVVTKTDLVDRKRLAEQLLAVSELTDFADVVPVNVATEDLKSVTSRLGMVQGFDVGLEMSGSQAALNQMVGSLVMGGRIALLGIPPGKSPVDWSRIVLKSLTIKGIYGREIFETWYKMIAMLENGLDVRRVITHRFPVSDYREGFEAMLSGKSGKVVLDWTA